MKKKDNFIWFKNWDSSNQKHLIRCKKILSHKSRIQKIEILESPIYGKILTLDNQIQIATKFNSYVHESLIHVPALAINNPKSVLIIGGGDGFSIGELLKYKNIGNIDLVEIDQDVCDICKKYLNTQRNFNNSRVNCFFMDGFDFVDNTKNKYDLIVLDISDPKDSASKIFSVEFLKKLKKIMTNKSAIVTHCESPDSAGDLFYKIISTYKEAFKYVSPFRVWIPHYIDFWGRLIASDTINPLSFSEGEIKKRIKKNGLSLQWLTPELYYSAFRSISKDVEDNLNLNWQIIHDTTKISFSRP